MLRALLILVAAGGLLPLGAGLWWGLELFAHFRLQYLAVAGLALVVALLTRRFLPALLLAGAAAVAVWPLLPYLPRAHAAGKGIPLVVLEVNVAAGNAEHDRIVELLRHADADVVTIIELTPKLANALVELEDIYPYRIFEPANTNFGIGVLSRFRLTGAESFALGRQTAIETRVELPAGPLTLLAVHTAPPVIRRLATMRNAQLVELGDRVAKLDAPVLVCGDFNLTPYSPYFDAFETASNTRAVRRGQGLGFSWPSFMPLLGIPIDHCFARGPLAVESVERMEQIGSDHYPVRVRMRWQSSP